MNLSLLRNYYYKHLSDIFFNLRASIIDEKGRPSDKIIGTSGVYWIGTGLKADKYEPGLVLSLTDKLLKQGLATIGYCLNDREVNELCFFFVNHGSRPVRIEDGDIIGSLARMTLQELTLLTGDDDE